MALNLLKKTIDSVLNYLINKGYEMIVEAQYRKQVGNDSYNQRDAYGALVYHNGVLKRKATLDPMFAEEPHTGWEKHGIKSDFGRNWLNDFVKSYDGAPKKGFALVIVNAAFYTTIQEQKYKYKVISQEYVRMEDLADKLGGTVAML